MVLWLQEVDLLSQDREDCGMQEDDDAAARQTAEDRGIVPIVPFIQDTLYSVQMGLLVSDVS